MGSFGGGDPLGNDILEGVHRASQGPEQSAACRLHGQAARGSKLMIDCGGVSGTIGRR